MEYLYFAIFQPMNSRKQGKSREVEGNFDRDKCSIMTKHPSLAAVDIWGGMKKWGADFGIPGIALRDCPYMPIIVCFCLVLATRLIKRYKYAIFGICALNHLI